MDTSKEQDAVVGKGFRKGRETCMTVYGCNQLAEARPEQQGAVGLVRTDTPPPHMRTWSWCKLSYVDLCLGRGRWCMVIFGGRADLCNELWEEEEGMDTFLTHASCPTLWWEFHAIVLVLPAAESQQFCNVLAL